MLWVSALVVACVAIVLAAFTFGAAAVLVVLAVIAAAAIIGTAAAGAGGRAAGFLAGATIGKAAVCYYRGQAYSEGATIKMEDGSLYECMADGKWATRS